jgi:hypothetical protein
MVVPRQSMSSTDFSRTICAIGLSHWGLVIARDSARKCSRRISGRGGRVHATRRRNRTHGARPGNRSGNGTRGRPRPAGRIRRRTGRRLRLSALREDGPPPAGCSLHAGRMPRLPDAHDPAALRACETVPERRRLLLGVSTKSPRSPLSQRGPGGISQRGPGGISPALALRPLRARIFHDL